MVLLAGNFLYHSKLIEKCSVMSLVYEWPRTDGLSGGWGQRNVFCLINSSLALVNHYFLSPSLNFYSKTLKIGEIIAKVTI